MQLQDFTFKEEEKIGHDHLVHTQNWELYHSRHKAQRSSESKGGRAVLVRVIRGFLKEIFEPPFKDDLTDA